MKLLIGLIRVVLSNVVAMPIIAQTARESSPLDHRAHTKCGAALSYKRYRCQTHWGTQGDLEVWGRACRGKRWRAIGPSMAGMSVRYIRFELGEQSVDLEHPPILLMRTTPRDQKDTEECSAL